MMKPTRLWFKGVSCSLTALTVYALCGPQLAYAAAVEASRQERMKALNLDARAQRQVTDYPQWKTEEAARTAVRRQFALQQLRQHSGAAAEEAKSAKVKKVALEIQRARPSALAERALARGKVMGLSPAQKQVELAKADPALAAKLKTKRAPALMPQTKPRLSPEQMTPVQLPQMKKPRTSPQHGALSPEMGALYASVSGQGAEVLRGDGTHVTVEEALAGLSVPPRAQLHASLTSDLGMLMAPLSALPAPVAEDLLETAETRRTPELLALVQQLGSRPLDLYNFVHTRVVPQLYYGSKKGSAQTLAELTGNDFDQASLLIAMLRAAGHPARYEYGTVELSAAQAISLTGAKDLASAVVMMSRTGPAALAPDGKSVQVERAWVRAHVAYGEGRGTGPGTEKIWVRLDPGMKETKHSVAVSLKGQAQFDRTAFASQPTTRTPLEVFEAQLLAAAKAKNLCNTLEEALSKVTVTQKPFELLPAEHPARVVQSLLVFARPPSTYRHLVDVTLDGVSTQLELAELEGRALSLTYPGASPADAATISAAGGIANVSPQSVFVRPTLALDGQSRMTFDSLNPGAAQKLVVRLTVPGGNAAVGVHHLVAGTAYSVLVEGGTPSAAQLTARMQAVTGTGEALALARSHAATAWYTHHAEAAYTRLFSLQGQASIKDAFIAVAGKQLRAEYFLGLPVGLAEGSYVIDVSRDSMGALPRDGDDSLHASLGAWAGWQGSVTEGRAWEAVLGGPGMSSVKALQVATAQSVPVYVLTPTNQANRSQLSGYSADSLADIDNALAAGWTATLPKHPVSIGRFQNVEGYVLENPVNGEGAFRLGSSLNGGEGDDNAAAGAGGNTPGAVCRQVNSTCGLSTGAWRMDRMDLMLPAVGLPVVFSRLYSSQAAELTALGYGWMHSYGMFLRAGPNGGFSYVSENWQEVAFTRVGSSYVTAPGWFFTLTDLAGGGHSMRSKEGIVWEFDPAGALTRISEPSGNATTLVYSAGKLSQVKDSSGQVALTLNYTGSKLTSVLDRAGRIVRFGHTNDDLTAATDVLNHTETYGYDNRHNLTSRIDKRGKAYLEFYDLQDRWVGFRDPAGNEATVAYDFVNSKTVYTDRTAAPWVTEFNSTGNATATVDPLGNRAEMTWDPNFRPLTSKDARGFTTTMTYDGQGNQLSREQPDGITTNFAYEANFSRLRRTTQSGTAPINSTFDAQGRMLTRTDGLGSTSYGYDALGQLQTVTAPGAAVTTFGRDAKGNVTTVTDATNRVTAMGYDSAGHLTSTTDGNLHTRTMEVDLAGRVEAMEDALTRRTEFTFDDEGNRLTSKDPANAVTHFEYDALGRLAKTTDALGRSTRTEYDAEERPVAMIDAKGNRSTLKYDASGRVVEMVSADGAVTSQAYCADVGQVCGRVDALGHLSTSTFDNTGRVTSETDALGRVTTTTYDFVGRPREVMGPNQPRTRYDYHLSGLVAQVTNLGLNLTTGYGYDARGNRTSVNANSSTSGMTTNYTFDAANRLLTEKNPLNTVTTYTYDAAGNRDTKLDGNGQTTQYRYDANRRLTEVEFSDGTKYEYGYDTRGNRTLEKNANHERQLAYDARNRLETVTDVTFGKTISYGYDENGNRASVAEGGTTFGYFYDSENRLKRADGFGGSLFFDYDAAGRRTSLLRPNGIRTSYSYDDANQLLSMTHAKGATVVLGFSYAHDGHGMRVSKTRENGYREGYTYDSGDRLNVVDYGNAKRVEYGLDALGNRVLEDVTTSPATGLVRNGGTFNGFNQLTKTGGPGSSFPQTDYAYDLNGNLLSETKASSGLPPELTTYTWDQDNRLRSVMPPSGNPTTYGYDANGLRTGRVDSSGTTRYLLDGSSVVAELDGSNAATLSYFNNPQMMDDVLAYQRGGATEYPLVDGLGSLYASTDSSGSVVHRYDFDVYGKRTDLGGTSPAIDRGYTGRRHDLNGLIEYWNRQRNPLLGGWMQPDRMGMADGPNPYNYVGANPVMFTDPTGLLTTDYDSLAQACGTGLGGYSASISKYRSALTWALAAGIGSGWQYADMLFEDGSGPVVEFVPGGLIDGTKFAATALAYPGNQMVQVGPIKISTRVVDEKDIDFLAHIIVHEIGHYAFWKSWQGDYLLPYLRSRLQNMSLESSYRNSTSPNMPTEGYQAEMQVFGEIRDR